MSGYLARLAARAGGAPAAPTEATPRLPSRFEPVGDGTVPDAAPSALDTAAAAPTTPGARAHAARADVESAERFGPSKDPVAMEGASSPGAARVDPARVPAHQRPDHEAATSGPDARPAPVPAALVSGRPVVATPRVEAEPPPRGGATDSVQRQGAASVPVSEPDVVHVTIGRIEVRATVAAPAAARPQRPARDPERSLHDYLAGRRP